MHQSRVQVLGSNYGQVLSAKIPSSGKRRNFRDPLAGVAEALEIVKRCGFALWSGNILAMARFVFLFLHDDLNGQRFNFPMETCGPLTFCSDRQMCTKCRFTDTKPQEFYNTNLPWLGFVSMETPPGGCPGYFGIRDPEDAADCIAEGHPDDAPHAFRFGDYPEISLVSSTALNMFIFNPVIFFVG